MLETLYRCPREEWGAQKVKLNWQASSFLPRIPPLPCIVGGRARPKKLGVFCSMGLGLGRPHECIGVKLVRDIPPPLFYSSFSGVKMIQAFIRRRCCCGCGGVFCVVAATTVSFEKQIGLQGQKLGSCNSVTLRFRNSMDAEKKCGKIRVRLPK